MRAPNFTKAPMIPSLHIDGDSETLATGSAGCSKSAAPPVFETKKKTTKVIKRMSFPSVTWASSLFEMSGSPVGVDALRRGRGANSLSKISR